MRTALKVLPGGLCPKCFGQVFPEHDEHGQYLTCLCGWEQDIVPGQRPFAPAVRKVKAKVDRRRRYSDAMRDRAVTMLKAGAFCREVAAALGVGLCQVQYWRRGIEGLEHKRGRRRRVTSTDVLTPAFPAWTSANPTVITERAF